MSPRSLRLALAVLACALTSFALAVPAADAASPDLVISQVYGGGGNTGGQYQNDFIELHNTSASAASLTGMSVAYFSPTTGNTGGSTALSGSVPAGGYFLVQEAAGAANPPAPSLPTPNATGNLNMGAASGRVDLLQGASVRDRVGWGTGAALLFEGAAAAPLLSNTTAALRAGSGCTDTDNNGADFTAATPAPRNAASAPVACATAPPGAVVATCGPTLDVTAGAAATRNVSATDSDGTVIGLAIGVVPAQAGVSLGSVTPAAGVGGTATATVSVSAAVPVGDYTVTLTATNNDTTPQTGLCSFTVHVAASGPTITPIHAIQGSGFLVDAAYRGNVVTIDGVVVGIDNRQGTSNAGTLFPSDRGLFVQEEDADADANAATSEGIFVGNVDTPTSFPPGTHVRVTGIANESFGLSAIQLSSQSDLVNEGTEPLPAPVVIDQTQAEAQTVVLPGGSCGFPTDSCTGGRRPYYESLEGMLVKYTSGTANSGGTDKFGETAMTFGSAKSVLLRNEETSGPGGTASARIRGLMLTNPDAGASNPLGLPIDDLDSTTFLHADQFDGVQNVVGPLTFSFTNYKVVNQPASYGAPFVAPTIVPGGTPYPFPGPPTAPANAVRVAEFNVENFFGVGGSLDGTTITAAQYAKKKGRIVDAIDRLLKRPDVIGVEEVDNLSILQDVASSLGGYTAYLLEGNDARGIDNGFLIKTGVTATNLRQFDKATTSTIPNCGGVLYNRPPLAIDITVRGLDFTAITNHWASKGSDDDGTCKAAQAVALRDHVKTLEDSGRQVIAMGDLNAYEDEQPVLTLGGPPTTLTNLWSLAPAASRYSYAFSGRLQTLDHILMTAGLMPAVRDFDYEHFDNNYYERTDAPTPDGHKLSDHDPPLVTLVAPTAPAVVTGAASSPTTSGVSLAGTVNPSGLPTAYVFEYGPTQSFGSITTPDGAGSGSSDVAETASVTGLAANTVYYYRLVATNSAGTSFGTVRSFRTGGTASAPLAVTLPETAVGSTSATLQGQVNPRGQQTAYTFEWGPSLTFGSITPVVALDDADALEPVSATLTSLAPGTTYFYRVVATNATGTTIGAIRAFTTGSGA